MKKYIVILYDNEQMYCPDLFASEKYIKALPHGYAFGINFDDRTEIFEVEERR